jgi:hypothetical protein
VNIRCVAQPIEKPCDRRRVRRVPSRSPNARPVQLVCDTAQHRDPWAPDVVHDAPQVRSVPKASKVSQALKVRPEPKDHRARKVLPVTKVRRAIKATRARAIKATRARTATRVNRVPLVSALFRPMAL